jgi:prevent-host-death family protein
MKTVGAYEAKAHLSRLLDKIRKGERFIITKHGTAVAVLQQADQSEKAEPATVIAEIRAFREQHRLGDVSIRELIEEGRR